MTIRRKKHLIIVYSMVLYGLIWPGSTLSNIEAVAPSKNERKIPEFTISVSYEKREAVPPVASAHKSVNLSDLGIATNPNGKDFEW